MVVCDTAKVRFFKQITTHLVGICQTFKLFAILQKYDFSSKSQLQVSESSSSCCCLRYCKSTIFQANHNVEPINKPPVSVVCDTAKVRFFKQITTNNPIHELPKLLFAILQKYDFSSKSQPAIISLAATSSCLRYCKSTIFQANHNKFLNCHCSLFVVCDTAKVRFFKQITTRNYGGLELHKVVCDTAKVRFFKQITTKYHTIGLGGRLFAILQKYDFSSKSQQIQLLPLHCDCCLRYCKSTIFQANHNIQRSHICEILVVCDTAKVRFFKQITTSAYSNNSIGLLFAILQKYDFSSKSQLTLVDLTAISVVCDTAKVRFFKQITTLFKTIDKLTQLFAILQKYDFSSKSQQTLVMLNQQVSCLRYCKSTIFQANHNRWWGDESDGNVVCDTAKVRFFKQITTNYEIQELA